MGIFRTRVGVRPTPDAVNHREIDNVMVDTGSEYNWFPEETLAEIGVVPMRIDRFETADRLVIERSVGCAVVDVNGVAAGTVVVFAQPGDMILLGAHGLEGMNLRIDLVKKELVPAGPVRAGLVA